MELEVGPFAEAVKRVALVAERNTPIRLEFTGDGLTLEAGAGDEATASETVEASFDGDELRVAFNPGYLLDGLGAIDSDTARISFTTPDPAGCADRQGRGRGLPVRPHAHPVGGIASVARQKCHDPERHVPAPHPPAP